MTNGASNMSNDMPATDRTIAMELLLLRRSRAVAAPLVARGQRLRLNLI